jgi:hypothetical protein
MWGNSVKHTGLFKKAKSHFSHELQGIYSQRVHVAHLAVTAEAPGEVVTLAVLAEGRVLAALVNILTGRRRNHNSQKRD